MKARQIGPRKGPAAGAFSDVSGTAFATANGAFATVAPFTFGGTANGAFSFAGADTASAYGAGSVAVGNASTAVGFSSLAVGERSIAVGNSQADGDDSIAIGTGAFAAGPGDTAVGQNAQVLANNSSSFGNGATVNPGHVNSTALGTNASTTYDNQVMMGTSTQTYTTPGITSALSQQRQSGPLQLTTTDMNGNLASDNGDTFKAVSKLQAGVAIALAAEAPTLTSSQTFGVRVGWGNYQGDANAVAASAIGVLCRNCFSFNDSISLDGSVGAGWSEFKTYNSGNVIGGRAGLSWAW